MTQQPRQDEANFWGATLFALFGPLVWATHFGFVYGFHHVACSRAVETPGGEMITGVIVVVTGIAVVKLALFGLKPEWLLKLFRAGELQPEMHGFLVAAMRIGILLSIFGVVWAGTGILFLSGCSPAR